MIKIATIARNPINSPNMAANDAAILESIAARLAARGALVTPLGENDELPQGTHAVCTMSRTSSTLQRLKAAEEQGVVVVNPTAAVENCSRTRFMEIMRANSIPQPPFKLISSASELMSGCYPCWIKKADGWSCHKDDVRFATTREESIETMHRMAQRGVTQCIQMQHCPGDIIKFYGVGTRFFRHCYPTVTKFGHEKMNGAPQGYRFDEKRLKETAQAAARVIGLQVYGGDAIITPQGDIYLIDMNDFPSFTAVRERAAEEIAELIMNEIGKTR